MKRPITISSIVLILIVLAGFGIFFVVYWREATPIAQDSSAAVFAAPATSTPTLHNETITTDTPAAPGTKRYYNEPHHFTLEYPQDLQVSEFPGADDSLVVTFKDPSTGEGFQIFAVPYDQSQITQERFLLDEPSGVMQDAQDITIDGAAATEFFSQSQAMGETREVWFLNGGMLYEVTTYKALDSWLMQILQTWRFVN